MSVLVHAALVLLIKPLNMSSTRFSDLDWFALETKMRVVVAELVEPLLRKTQEHSNTLGGIERRNADQSAQLRDLEAIVCKGTDRRTFVDELIHKVETLAVSAEVAEVKSRQNFENCMKHLSAFEHETSELKQDLARSEAKYSQLIQDYSKISAGLTEYQGKVHEEFQKFNAHVEAATKQCNQALKSAETLAENASNLSKNVNQQLPDLKGKLNDLQTFTVKLSHTISEVEASKANLKDTKAELNEVSASQLKFQHEQNETKKALDEVARFVEKYLPLQIQTSIASNLFVCLERKHLRLLAKHDQQILASLNEQLIETSDPCLDNVVEGVIQACLLAEDRNTEFYLKLKSSGSSAFRPSSSSYMQGGASRGDIVVNEFPQDSRVSSAKMQRSAAASVASQREIKAEGNSDISDADEEAPGITTTEGKELKRLVQEAIIEKSEFVTHVEKQLDNFKGYVSRGDDEVKLYVQVLQGQLENLQDKITRDISQYKLGASEIEGKRADWVNTLERLTQELANLSQMIACLVESALITQSLLAQDEEDKSTLKLTGLKNIPTPMSPALKLKPDCLSCTGQGSMLASAFKLACISYEPSTLNYRNKTFTRPQLLTLLGSLVQSSWQSVSARPPFDNFPQRVPSKPPSAASSRRRAQSRESSMRKTSVSFENSMRSSYFPTLKVPAFQET
jgi:DNA repair exonuclease SbcCD ATPase subunit